MLTFLHFFLKKEEEEEEEGEKIEINNAASEKGGEGREGA